MANANLQKKNKKVAVNFLLKNNRPCFWQIFNFLSNSFKVFSELIFFKYKFKGHEHIVPCLKAYAETHKLNFDWPHFE